MDDSRSTLTLLLDALPWLLGIGLTLYYGAMIIRGYPDFRRRHERNRDYRRENKERRKGARAMAAERDRIDQEAPPWVEPRMIDSSMNEWAYRALLDRLEPVESSEAYSEPGEILHDPHTGQVWNHFEDEVGFNQFMALSPLSPRGGH